MLLLVVHLCSVPVLLNRLRDSNRFWWGIVSLFILYAVGEYGTALHDFEVQGPKVHHSTASSESLSILYMNKYVGNPETEGAMNVVADKNADIVVILEANENWIAGTDLRSRYPYHIESLAEDGWSIAIYSRLKPIGEVRKTLGEDVNPIVMTRLIVGETKEIPLVVLHLPRPLNQLNWQSARYAVRRLSTEIRHSNEPWIVIGDFNSGPFGRVYESFVNAARVDHASLGHGYFATWNALYPVLRGSIDHIFIKEGISVGRFEKVTVPGSDHWGIYTELTVN